MTEPTVPAGDGEDFAPLTVSDVLDHYGWPASDRASLVGTVAAVNSFVRRTPGVTVGADGDVRATADALLGATLLAGRLHQRRGTPNGLVPFGEGVSAYVRKNDPDVGMMLRLGMPRAR